MDWRETCSPRAPEGREFSAGQNLPSLLRGTGTVPSPRAPPTPSPVPAPPLPAPPTHPPTQTPTHTYTHTHPHTHTHTHTQARAHAHPDPAPTPISPTSHPPPPPPHPAPPRRRGGPGEGWLSQPRLRDVLWGTALGRDAGPPPCRSVSVPISRVPERRASSRTTKSAPRQHRRVLLSPTRPRVRIHVEVAGLPVGCTNRIHTASIVFPLRWAALSGEIVWVSKRASTEGNETETAAKSRER